ncbi:MAG: rod shape-determining protein [Eggerthellaceae bacterium]
MSSPRGHHPVRGRALRFSPHRGNGRPYQGDLQKTNPDLASDISNGILLTGGGGLLSGLDRFLTQRLEIPVWTSETALTNVAMGCLKVLETPSALKQTLMRSK